MDEITKVVRDYIVREYLEEDDERTITDTTPLISGGIVDSFSMVSLLRFIEKKYSIDIPDQCASSRGLRHRRAHRGAGAAFPEG